MIGMPGIGILSFLGKQYQIEPRSTNFTVVMNRKMPVESPRPTVIQLGSDVALAPA